MLFCIDLCGNILSVAARVADNVAVSVTDGACCGRPCFSEHVSYLVPLDGSTVFCDQYGNLLVEACGSVDYYGSGKLSRIGSLTLDYYGSGRLSRMGSVSFDYYGSGRLSSVN